MRHTPGPWYTTTKKDDSQGMISQETTGKTIAVSYDSKDAAIIAAAPELLEALEALQACMIYRSTVEGDLPWTVDVVDAMDKTRFAISKAKGE